MRCKAKEAGWSGGRYIEAGEVFNYAGHTPPVWAESLTPSKSKVAKTAETAEATQVNTESVVGESAEMLALREKAKEAGYKYWQNAGKKKLIAAIAKADAEREAKEAEEAQAVADKEAEEAEKAAQAAEEAKADAEGK